MNIQQKNQLCVLTPTLIPAVKSLKTHWKRGWEHIRTNESISYCAAKHSTLLQNSEEQNSYEIMSALHVL